MSSTAPPHLFLECTRTLRSSLHTGIERVVRNVIENSQEVSQSLGIVCQPIVYHPLHGFVPVEMRAEFDRASQGVPSAHSKLKRQLEAWGLLPIARSSSHRLKVTAMGVQSLFQPLSKRRLQFRPEDVLLLLDSSWTTPYWKEVRRAQEAGAAVGAMVYDLLPVQIPDSLTRPQRDSFRAWWNKANQAVDFVTAISHSVSRDVSNLQETSRTGKGKMPVGAFRLGVDFLSPRANLPIREELAALGTDDAPPFSLCVGTISPRKQQTLILDAFERLWNRGIQASLVYVGGSGWHSKSFLKRLRNHPQWGWSLCWFEDLNDRELAWCYHRARALVTASLGEGFNLPIVEALHQGCPVIASDIPVHREVGGAFASYFPKENAAALADIIERHQQTGRLDGTEPIERFRWPDWKASSEELVQLVLRLAEESRTNDRANGRSAA